MTSAIPARRPASRSRGTRSSCASAARCETPCARTASWPAPRARVRPSSSGRSTSRSRTQVSRSSSPTWRPRSFPGAANAFLAAKISFINAMADICAATGGDVRALAAGLGTDSRIGPAFLKPGVGYGGACLPTDVRGLGTFARRIGVSGAADLLAAVDAINEARPGQVIGVIRHMLGTLAGTRIGVWGAAFKPGTDDVPRFHRATGCGPPAPARRRGDRLRPDGGRHRPGRGPRGQVRRLGARCLRRRGRPRGRHGLARVRCGLPVRGGGPCSPRLSSSTPARASTGSSGETQAGRSPRW